MSRVRIRVELFKGEEYIDLARLSALPEELNKLLRSIGDDAGILPLDNDWKASEFKDGSLEFTAYSSDRLSTQVAARCAALSDAIFSGDADAVYKAGGSDRTILQYAQFARKIRAGEVIRVGVFKTSRSQKPVRWHHVTATNAAALTASIKTQVDYHGAALGLIHSLYKEAERPHFDLRDANRGGLVKCFYPRELYPAVIAALNDRERYVHVSGIVRANRIDKVIESITVERIEPTEQLSEADFAEFIGSAPTITGDRSTEDYISEVREDL